jgi:hypothetical protein
MARCQSEQLVGDVQAGTGALHGLSHPDDAHREIQQPIFKVKFVGHSALGVRRSTFSVLHARRA